MKFKVACQQRNLTRRNPLLSSHKIIHFLDDWLLKIVRKELSISKLLKIAFLLNFFNPNRNNIIFVHLSLKIDIENKDFSDVDKFHQSMSSVCLPRFNQQRLSGKLVQH